MDDCLSILLVEDDSDLRRATSHLLSEAAYRVMEAATGDEGLRLARQWRPDLILLGQVPPDFDTLEVCRRIKADARLTGCQVLLWTALVTGPDEQIGGIEASVDGYIPRPISGQELLAQVQSALRLKRAEDALSRSRAEFEAIFNSTSDAIVLADTQRHIVATNPAFTTLFGYELPEAKGRSTQFLYETEADYEEQGRRRYQVGIKPEGQPFEIRYRRKDGSLFTAESLGLQVLDAQGRLIGFAGVHRDITARKRAEEALAKNTLLLETILDHTHMLIAYLDPEFNFVRVNRQYAEADEREPSFFPGKNHFDLYPNPENEHMFRQVVETGRPHFVSAKPFEYAEHPERGVSHWDWSLVPIKDENRTVTGLVLTLANVTERVQAEEALREAKETADRARRKEERRRQEAERRRQIAEGLGDVLAALNTDQSLDDVLDLIATHTRELLGTDAVLILRLDAEAGHCSIQAAQGLPADLLTGVAPLLSSRTLRQVVASRRPVPGTDVTATLFDAGHQPPDAAGQALVALWAERYHALLAVPVLVRDEIDGLMLLLYTGPAAFTTEDLELATLLGTQVALAVENARLRYEVEKSAVTAERSRLARELHDAVTQSLFSASLIAEVLPVVWERNQVDGRRGLEELRRLTLGALAEMRTLLLELRPAGLTEQPLDVLIRRLADGMEARTRIPVTVTVHGERALPSDVHIALYRITQEALNNIDKHARAGRASVSLRNEPERVILCVGDDGRGFEPGTAESHQLGIGIMRERARAIGASFRIESQPGQGTEMMVVWPEAGNTFAEREDGHESVQAHSGDDR